MKFAELKSLSEEQLNKELESKRHELLSLRFRHATGQLEKTAEIPATKRTIARILTLLSENKRERK